MDLNDLRSVATVLVFLAFIAIAVWAWSSRRRDEFDAAAQLPFAEDGARAHRGENQ